MSPEAGSPNESPEAGSPGESPEAAGEDDPGGDGPGAEDAGGEAAGGDGSGESPEAAGEDDPGGGGPGAEDADAENGLPAELDPSTLTAAYLFPDNSRRRVAGGLYVLLGGAGLGASVAFDGSVLVNSGFVLGAAVLILVGIYCLQAGWRLTVDENDALVAAARAVGFPVGHASARLGWRGLRSRPTWRILLYSNDSPPAQRGIVLVDGVDGGVVAHFAEANPEDWHNEDWDNEDWHNEDWDDPKASTRRRRGR